MEEVASKFCLVHGITYISTGKGIPFKLTENWRWDEKWMCATVRQGGSQNGSFVRAANVEWIQLRDSVGKSANRSLVAIQRSIDIMLGLWTVTNIRIHR